MTAPCKLFVTYRSEYLVLRDLCVGVRDRKSGAWIPLHSAACSQVLGPLGGPLGGMGQTHPLEGSPARVGERLSLYASARRVVTGAIVAIEEASPSMIADAEKSWQALFSAHDPRHSTITIK
jgi:hypothetical protein